MEIVQILIGSMFSLIAMASVLYIAFRAHTMAGELSEIKELLKDSRRATTGVPATEIATLDRAVANQSLPYAAGSYTNGPHAPGEWPSVMDPEYNTGDSTRPSGSQR